MPASPPGQAAAAGAAAWPCKAPAARTMAGGAAAMAELRPGWARRDFMGWKLLPTQWRDLGSPINAATECSVDTDQNLLKYRFGITSIQLDLGSAPSVDPMPPSDKFLGISWISGHPFGA